MITQPAIPTYRLDFFDRLARHYGDQFRVYSADNDLGVIVPGGPRPVWSEALAPPTPLFGANALVWQASLLGFPINRGDIVVVSGAPRNVSNLALLARARLKGAKTIWWGHLRSAKSQTMLARFRMKLAALSHAILFYTEKEKSEFDRAQPQKTPTFYLNNGLDNRKIKQLRAGFTARERDKAVLFIGRITPKANLELLLRSLAKPACAQISLHVIGDGDDKDRLKAIAVQTGIHDRIIWHRGTTDEETIACIANRCRAFVYPGAVGLSLIHALNYGLPAILHEQTDRHMPEIAAFEPGRNGEVFAFEDDASLAASLSDLLASQERLDRYAERAIAVTADNFTTETMASRFIDMIDQIAPDGCR